MKEPKIVAFVTLYDINNGKKIVDGEALLPRSINQNMLKMTKTYNFWFSADVYENGEVLRADWKGHEYEN